jgi:hypothetical protein
MSLNINIENYEAFYLDFLEGNLNEQEMQEFSAFLDLHPELKVEDDFLNLELDSCEVLDKSFVNSLKIDSLNAKISSANCEEFFVAFYEKTLSQDKINELTTFLNQHPSLKSDFELYRLSFLKVDTSIVYEDKKSIKRGVVIPMYVRLVAVAAAIILVLLVYPFSNETSLNVGSANHIAASLNSLSGRKIEKNSSASENNKEVNFTKLTNEPKENSNFQNSVFEANEAYSLASVGNLNLKKIGTFSHSKVKFLEPEEFDQAFYFNKSKKNFEDQNDDANTYLSFRDMKNPAPVVTNGLKERLQKEVDFRSAKATRNKQGGFFLKIGKFEISRKTAPINTDVLATN